MKVKSEREVAQSCLTLSDSMDGSPPGSSVHGIFQARVLEWGAIAFSVSKAYFYLKCICGKLSIDFIIFLLLCIAFFLAIHRLTSEREGLLFTILINYVKISSMD